MTIYKNIIFYNGDFYTDKEKIKINYTHNRLKTDEYIFMPRDINTIEIKEEFINFNYGLLLLDHFHHNPAHNIWDHIYPSWYGLFRYLNDYSEHLNFQYIVKKDINETFGIQHINMIETFSGNKPMSICEFSKKNNKPLIIPWLVIGLENIGIGHIYKENLLAKRGLEINNIDPIEVFVNRIYFKYNIKRNTLLLKSDFNECNNIIFIKNKRPFNEIKKLFNKMNNKYKGKYNFKIIDYSKYSFKEQLQILNNTCLCIVGVGSARFNTPFLPNGAIEIQVFQPNINRKKYIEYIDYHGGTLSKYVKIKNIPYYTKEEAKENKYSHLLESYIYESLSEVPCKVPINLEENIPLEIQNLKNHINYNKKFDLWRNSNSNIVEDFMNMLDG
jgi:hypothetical protein